MDPWSIVKMIRDCKGMLEVREIVRSVESPGVTYSKLERIVRHWKRKIDTGKIKMKCVESGRLIGPKPGNRQVTSTSFQLHAFSSLLGVITNSHRDQEYTDRLVCGANWTEISNFSLVVIGISPRSPIN